MNDNLVNNFKLLTQTVVAFVVVLLLLFLLLKWMARWQHKHQSSSLLRNIGRLQIDQKHTVHLLEVAGEYYLIGVGDNVSLIAHIQNKAEIDALVQSTPQQMQRQDFSQLLKTQLAELMKRRKSDQSQLFHDQHGRDKDE